MDDFCSFAYHDSVNQPNKIWLGVAKHQTYYATAISVKHPSFLRLYSNFDLFFFNFVGYTLYNV